MECRRVIIDECGTVVRFWSDYTDIENMEFLEEYPECRISTVYYGD